MAAIDRPARSGAGGRPARTRPRRRQVQVATRQSVDERDFVSAIVDAVGAIVIVVDAQGRLARYNTAASTVSGYSPAEIDAHGSLDFLVPLEQRPELLEVLGELEPGGEVNRRDNEWVRKDGTRRHIAWANTAVFDRDGLVRYTIATGIDHRPQEPRGRARPPLAPRRPDRPPEPPTPVGPTRTCIAISPA